MKASCYLRIARKRRARWGESQFIFDVGVKEPAAPLRHDGVAVRTAVIKLNLEFPATLFGPAAELDVEVPATSVRVLGDAGA